MGRVVGYSLGGCVGKAVGITDDEGFENVFWIEVAFAVFLSCCIFVKQLLLFTLGRYWCCYSFGYSTCSCGIHSVDNELDVFAHDTGKHAFYDLGVIFFQHGFKKIVFDSNLIVFICDF